MTTPKAPTLREAAQAAYEHLDGTRTGQEIACALRSTLAAEDERERAIQTMTATLKMIARGEHDGTECAIYALAALDAARKAGVTG